MTGLPYVVFGWQFLRILCSFLGVVLVEYFFFGLFLKGILEAVLRGVLGVLLGGIRRWFFVVCQGPCCSYVGVVCTRMWGGWGGEGNSRRFSAGVCVCVCVLCIYRHIIICNNTYGLYSAHFILYKYIYKTGH